MEDKEPIFAFPNTDGTSFCNDGMTLLDYFANTAMIENMRRAYPGNDSHIAEPEYDKIAKYSYDMAKAMIKQREL